MQKISLQARTMFKGLVQSEAMFDNRITPTIRTLSGLIFIFEKMYHWTLDKVEVKNG